MIFQINVPLAGNVVQPVPFVGPCTVKIVKIDYIFDTAAAIQQAVIAINSSVLINTALSGRILFFNTTNPYFGSNFILPELIIPGQIDIQLSTVAGGALPAGAGGYSLRADRLLPRRSDAVR